MNSSKIKKAILFFALAVAVFALCTVFVGAEKVELPDLSKVQNVYIYNMENDKILHSKNENDRIYPASTAKIMTGIIALEHYQDRMKDIIIVSKDSLGNYKGKNIKLKDGEVVNAENLIYAMICGGANDAANVLAYEIAGSHDAFLNMMNQKAKTLGMTDTYYNNAYGYSDPSMYTTAKDVCILAKYAYLANGYMDICNTVRYEFPETNSSKARYIYNSNYLIATNAETKYRNKEVQGMNAGSTVEGGHVVVTTVSRNGMTNFYVLMGGHMDDENIYTYSAVRDVVDWSYKSFEYKKIVDSSEMICEIPVSLSSDVDYVVLSPDKTVEKYLPVEVDIEKDIKRSIELHDKKLNAPVEAGYSAGEMVLSYNGEEVARVNLVTKNNVSRNGFLYILARIESLTKSPKFKIVMLVLGGVLALYVISLVYRRIRGNRYRYKYSKYRKRR